MKVREQREAWERAVMLRGVRRKVADELRAALGTAGRIDVPMVHSRAGGAAEPLPAGAGLVPAYQRARDSLLVLGSVGSGKTTALYELTAHLLTEAEGNPDRPVPVVVHLSSWRRHHGQLEPWLADELIAGYEVPDELARNWVAEERVVPLLDGLDELTPATRTACAEQINAFRRRHGLVRLVLCATAATYQPLSRIVPLREVVELQPLDQERITIQLGRAGLDLGDEERADPELWELLASPLMVGLVMAAYRGQGRLALPTGPVQQRRAQVCSDYLARAVAAEPGTSAAHSPEQTLHWLAHLARLMRQRGDSEFRLDLLQPDWLPRRVERRLVLLTPHLLAAALALLLSFGLYAPLAGALPALGLASVALMMNALIGAQLGPRDRFAIQPVRRGDWRPPRTRLGRSTLNRLALNRLALALDRFAFALDRFALGRFALDRFTPTSAAHVWPTGPEQVPDNGPEQGLEHRSSAGIKRSARQAAVAAGWALGLVLPPLVAIWVADRASPFAVQLAATVVLVLVVLVLPVAMHHGGQACCRHLALRALLVLRGQAPWRWRRLLEDSTRHRLLVRSGTAYRFLHRFVLDHLAHNRQATTASTASPERSTAAA